MESFSLYFVYIFPQADYHTLYCFFYPLCHKKKLTNFTAAAANHRSDTNNVKRLAYNIEKSLCVPHKFPILLCFIIYCIDNLE